MAIDTPKHCVEISVPPSSEQLVAEWVVESASTAQRLATLTQQSGEYNVTACWEEDFECASLQAVSYMGNAYQGLQVAWNGVVVMDQTLDLTMAATKRPLVLIGDSCHKHLYQVCDNFRDDTWLLDVEFTTAKDDGGDLPIYWRVYADIGSGWGNLDHGYGSDAHKPETTYRILRCMQNDFPGLGCTEFGLSKASHAVMSGWTIQVNGNVKDEIWECDRPDQCSDDIVIPLRGCWGPNLSNGATAGIVIAVILVIPMICLCFAVPWYSARTKCDEKTKEQPKEEPTSSA